MAGGGYGGGPYGGGPYGGAAPPVSPFDLFCFEHCATMLAILTDPNVSTEGPGGHFASDASTCDLIISSGGAFPTTNPRLIVTTSVPQQFTLEWTARFDELPINFNDLTNEHVFVGTTDAAGPCAGLFISQIGIMYAGGVHHDGFGNLIVDSTTQIIADTASLITLGNYITFRMSVSLSANVVYIFVTPTSEIPTTGQQLVAVLPVIPASALSFPPTDRTQVSIRGGTLTPSIVSFDQLCLSSAVIIPNLLPVADAGMDQAVRSCSIALLDGSESFDPEGAPLVFQWRLTDTPLGSDFAEELNDGRTTPIDSSFFTNKFHSSGLGVIDGSDPIDPGDVLLLDAVPRTVISTGTEVSGPFTGVFFLLFGDQDIPDALAVRPFKVLRQRGISLPTTVKPTFFPDIPGFYTFDLTVNDGALTSKLSVVIVNVLESPLPRGCTPNLNFIFTYLSDFWNLVEDRDPIEAFWGGLAQVAATELYTLWQVEYSKSLRDIQRHFIRRWLHYDPLLPEPIPELTRIRAVWAGVSSDPIAAVGVSGISGTDLVLTSPSLDTDFSYTFLGADPFTATAMELELLSRLQAFDSRFSTQVFTDGATAVAATGTIGTVVPGSYADSQTFTLDDGVNPAITFEFDTVPDGVGAGNVVLDISAAVDENDVRDIIIAAIDGVSLLNITPSIGGVGTVALVNLIPGVAGNVTIGTTGAPPGSFTGMAGGVDAASILRIDAPFPFSISENSTIPGSVYPVGRANAHPSSTSGGAGIGGRTYKVPISLLGLDLVESDFLTLDGDAFRIERVVTDAGDDLPFQRLVLKEDLPAAPSTAWDISGWVSSELIDFYNGLVAAGDTIFFEVVDIVGDDAPNIATNELITTTVLGVNEALPGRAAFVPLPIGGFLGRSDEVAVRFAKAVRRKFIPVSSLALDIPTLSERIVIETTADEESVLRRNLDFFIEDIRNGKGIRFVADATQVTPDVWEGVDPPDRLWAEYTFLDNRPVIEANFGIPAEFTLDQLDDLPEDVDYLSAVRGLWYAFLNGPTVRNLAIGTQILLGLPFAEEVGTIEEIRTDFSPNEGRILIRDTKNTEIVRSYNFPRTLTLEVNPKTGVLYAEGDVVTQFAPLVEGSEVIDYVKDPRWFEGILNQGIFFEIEKFHRFLVRVDSDAFNLSALTFVRTFILKIKPTYTFPFFLVQKEIGDTEVSVTDDVETIGTLILTDSPCEDFLGSTTIYDDPRAAGGGWRSQFDADPDPDNPAPSFPTSDPAIFWGYDKAYNCPLDPAVATCCVTFAIATTVTFDSCLTFGQPVNVRFSYLEIGPIHVPVGPPGLALTATSSTAAPITGTISKSRLLVVGGPGADVGAYELIISINAADEPAIPFQSVDPHFELTTVLAVAVVATDVVTARIRPSVGGRITVVSVSQLVDGETFTLDDGTNPATVFEFDVAGDGIGGGVAVDVSILTTANQVRDAMIAAINGAASLDITAYDDGSGRVGLFHDTGSTATAVAILESVADAGFVVLGMQVGATAPAWTSVNVDFDQLGATVWTFDSTLDPGRYCQEITL